MIFAYSKVEYAGPISNKKFKEKTHVNLYDRKTVSLCSFKETDFEVSYYLVHFQ